MKIDVFKEEKYNEIEVTICCHPKEKNVDNIVSALQTMEEKIIGTDSAGKTVTISTYQIYYIEAVDKKTFLYTELETYEVRYRLFELEKMLPEIRFHRISKSMIVNISKIKSLQADLGRRLRIVMDNKENLIVSRQYAVAFKSKLGIKGGRN